MTAGALMLTANNYTKAITHCQRNQSARDAISLTLSTQPPIHPQQPPARAHTEFSISRGETSRSEKWSRGQKGHSNYR